jgi:D-lactate dehydrogenase
MATVPSENQAQLIETLRRIVGKHHVLTSRHRTRRYRRGFRSGEGAALALVLPGRLLEQWRVLQACVAAGAAIIMQAANRTDERFDAKQ